MTTQADTTYEGWTNRETWCVVLWIRNDEPRYDEARSMVPGLVEMIEREGINNAADYVQDWVEGWTLGDDPGATLATDLITGALARVDWREVIGAMIEDAS